MAGRNAQKKAGVLKPGKTPARSRAPVARAAAKGSEASPSAALERERDALKEDLRLAREEIARLRREREQAVNHIEWVIDSLHNLLEDDD